MHKLVKLVKNNEPVEVASCDFEEIEELYRSLPLEVKQGGIIAAVAFNGGGVPVSVDYVVYEFDGEVFVDIPDLWVVALASNCYGVDLCDVE